MTIYEDKCMVRLRVNGEEHVLCARPADLLLDVLRTQLGLTGAKPGCLNGDCGACTVLIDGRPAKACLVLAAQAEGYEIFTVEGLGGHTPIQRAFVEQRAFQCGYCTSGFLMACHGLCLHNPQADEAETRHWLDANLCRCTCYEEIGAAVKQAMEETIQLRKGVI